MKKLIIDKIDKYNYCLKNDEKSYNLNIEFYGLSKPLEIGDIIYLHENVLNNKILSFGPMDDNCGRKITSNEDEDLIVVITKDGQQHFCKRLYG